MARIGVNNAWMFQKFRTGKMPVSDAASLVP